MRGILCACLFQFTSEIFRLHGLPDVYLRLGLFCHRYYCILILVPSLARSLSLNLPSCPSFQGMAVTACSESLLESSKLDNSFLFFLLECLGEALASLLESSVAVCSVFRFCAASVMHGIWCFRQKIRFLSIGLE